MFGKKRKDNPGRSRDAPAREISGAETPTQVSGYGIFENRGLTPRGEPTGYDFDSVLRDPQTNIEQLYELSSYYKEADPMYGGSIRNVYVPFSIARGYRLVGASEKTKKLYKEHYRRIGFDRKLAGILDQRFTFANVYIYLTEEGNILTLQPKQCRIADVSLAGEPIVEFNLQDLNKKLIRVGSVEKPYLDDFTARIYGVPAEVKAALNSSAKRQWVQLNPENTFVLQGVKPDWLRYAIPPVAPCLKALRRKALIEEYESAQLNFGAKSFLHVTVGDKDPASGMNKPDQKHITAMNSAFEAGLQGGRLVVTPWYVKAGYVGTDTKTLFDNDKYAGVNADILSACGISGVISNGQQEAGSYGQAKLSLEAAANRIRQAQSECAEIMNKINRALAGRIRGVSGKNVPVFEFPAVDLTNDGKFAEAVYKLWQQGMVSNRTMLEGYELDITQELERRRSEAAEGQGEVFIPPQNAYTSNTGGGENTGGRPELDDGDRSSDPANSETGAQPKPSRPEGSEPKGGS